MEVMPNNKTAIRNTFFMLKSLRSGLKYKKKAAREGRFFFIHSWRLRTPRCLLSFERDRLKIPSPRLESYLQDTFLRPTCVAVRLVQEVNPLYVYHFL